MKGTKFLSELITDYHSVLPGKINIVEANTSGGKTWFALNTLPEWAGSPEKVLYLIDTSNGELRLQQNIIAVSRLKYALSDYASGRLWGEFADMAKEKMPVMTYAGFGAEIRSSGKPFWQKFEYIVCDEMQNLVKYGKFNGGSDLLEQVKTTLRLIADEGKAKIIALTATPGEVRKHFGDLCRDVLFDTEELICYETFQTETYTGIEAVLLKHIGQTGILYTQHVKDMKKAIDFARCYGIRANGFWSINSDTKMMPEQLALRDTVLTDEYIPDDLDLLVINASSETCIKIQSEKSKVDYMIIHTSDEEVQIQVRGRYCGDLPMLYLHDTAIAPENIQVPTPFISKKLFTKDKEELCQALNLRSPSDKLYKWKKVKELLTEGGYTINEGREGNNRYALILPKQVGSVL